ncbi:DNA polymerase III subunit psi [Vibrio astriarenae]|uniref:DNA polymerase III subunit psi n=1 Tax=Vibrio astriarenae TaxID=1481923 RepID=A0A7Z2T4N2_9VIBR|nr:DNA polymerase III subunit psi [Vibrio astriarenae]QIA64103.1 DNA polymerase III subunit psi [Vibrio astriarenae]
MTHLNQSQRHAAYLKEMGITQWTVTHPERLEAIEVSKQTLDASCRLLLVSPSCPQGALVEFLAKVLKAMSLSLEQIRHIEPQNWSQIELEGVEWVWFAGCPEQESTAKVLTSPLLEQIDGNNQQRRALWSQIQSQQ